MKGIPEENYSTQNLIRRRRRNDEINRKREEGRVKDVMMSQRQKKQKELNDKVQDPEFFANRYRKQQRSYVVYKRKKNAVKNHTAQIEKTEDGVILALRVKGATNASKQENHYMIKLNLTKKHNAAFIPNTIENLKTLKKCENYLVYGPPSKALIDDLVRHRGFTKVEGKKTALTDNNMVEKALGDIDIICIEDIVEHIHKGQNLDRINDFLYTFLLSHNKFMDKKYAKRDKPKVYSGTLGQKPSDQLDKIIRSYF
jgi:large subunit ribosomal protein L7e